MTADPTPDLVTDLRNPDIAAGTPGMEICRQAAAEIERLQAENLELQRELNEQYMRGYKVGVADGFSQ